MPSQVRVLAFATGDLAIPVVEAVAAAGHDVVTIVAQPSRRDTEGILPEERQGSALVRWARRSGIDVRRTSAPGSERLRAELEDLAPDLGLVVAYGRRFPESLLDLPPRGWLKVHFSLLPKHRGLHPIRSALWSGDRQTGASVIRMTEEPDAGPILAQQALDVGPNESFGELAPRVAALGAALVVPAIDAACRRGRPKERKQNERAASSTPRFGRRHRLAPWWREAKVVYARLRALSPEPGMTTLVRGRRVRILAGSPAEHVESHTGEAGSFIGLRSGSVAVLCGRGTVFGIDRVQPEGARPMSASRFVRSVGLRVGNVLV